MNDNFLIIGAGQHCNVVIYNAKAEAKHTPIAILDSDKSKSGSTSNGIVIDYYDINDKASVTKVVEKYKTNKFFIGFGNMKYRMKTFQTLVSWGLEPINIIHPNAVVSPSAVLGKGVLIECGCLVTPSPRIGDNVVINTGSQVNHDNIIGDHVYIASGVVLSGGVRIGTNSLIDDGVIVSLGRSIGANCIVGAGAVVTKDIPDRVVAFGNPCKVIRPNE